jgi:ATP-dependent DNA helicase PIF1
MRLLGGNSFPLTAVWPPVLALCVHLPDEQKIYYTRNHTEEQIRQMVNNPKYSRLTAWFADLGRARDTSYLDFPKHFVWDDSGKKWHIRKQFSGQIGRIHTVAPREADRFHLRLLLVNVKGATSYEDLRTVTLHSGERRVCETFQDACIALGLLDDDAVWDKTMEEAALRDRGIML